MSEAMEGKISLETYLRHELSHSLIFQQTGFFGALKFPDWLLEGLAMYSSDQMGTTSYPDKTETYSLIARGNFMPPTAYKTRKEDNIKLEVPERINFIYSEFACIVDYMIENYGKEKFLDYIKSLMRENDHGMVFIDIYSLDYETFLTEFRTHVSDNS